MRGGCAADENVDPGKLPRPILETHGTAPQFTGQFRRALIRTIAENDAASAPADQSAGGFLACISGADDHYRMVAQRTEELLRQFDCDGANRDAAALDVGFRADLLGNVERLLKRLVEPPAGVFMFQGRFVGLLQLAEYFRLSQNHRIQTGGDPEEMFQGFHPGVGVDFITQGLVILVVVK